MNFTALKIEWFEIYGSGSTNTRAGFVGGKTSTVEQTEADPDKYGDGKLAQVLNTLNILLRPWEGREGVHFIRPPSLLELSLDEWNLLILTQ